MIEKKERAGRNRTITLSDQEKEGLSKKLIHLGDGGMGQSACKKTEGIIDKTIHSDLLTALPQLPDAFADLIIIDPPYNLTKDFNGNVFSARKNDEYEEYLATWFPAVCRKLKDGGSLYMCGDWKCTSALQRAMERELTVINRITGQRKKGRGAKSNGKNGMEDIWFAVKNPDNYYFNV